MVYVHAYMLFTCTLKKSSIGSVKGIYISVQASTMINNHTLTSDCVWWWYCRYEKLEAEALAGEERFEEIVKKWDATTGKTIPQVKYTCNT